MSLIKFRSLSFTKRFLSSLTTEPNQTPQQKEKFRFEVIHKSTRSKARLGIIHTPHGIIETPGFVPVATSASLKHVSHATTNVLHNQLMFCNTFHLLIQPGPKVIEDAGGLHKFMNYNGPLITDSGGFQIFSLSNKAGEVKELKGQSRKKTGTSFVKKVTEEGVLFRSYKDGKLHLLTPEKSVQLQKSFGADIIIPLDELPSQNVTPQFLETSLDRTHRWEIRSLNEHLKNPKNQAMYCVVHGGDSLELRTKSFKYLSSYPFDGIAIGGSLGTTQDDMQKILSSLELPLSETQKPIHLLGIGDPRGIDAGVRYGIDTFDSCYPTRAGRHGHLLTFSGKIDIHKKIHENELFPVDSSCDCDCCTNYTRSYLHHLLRAKEPTYLVLASIHNLRFMTRLMEQYRSQILNDEI